MLQRLFALGLFAGMPFLATAAFGQTGQAQSPIECGKKDLVEDADCRQKLKGLFTRKGSTLTLNLDGGKSKTYVGNHAACRDGDASKCLVFRVESYFPQTRSYLVQRGHYECGGRHWVSRRTGSEIEIDSTYPAPVLSPNAKYLLSLDRGEACDSKYYITIWSMATDPPKLEFTYRNTQYEMWEVTSWDDDTHIRMTAWINTNEASYDQEAELVREKSGWALRLGRKIDRPR